MYTIKQNLNKDILNNLKKINALYDKGNENQAWQKLHDLTDDIDTKYSSKININRLINELGKQLSPITTGEDLILNLSSQINDVAYYYYVNLSKHNPKADILDITDKINHLASHIKDTYIVTSDNRFRLANANDFYKRIDNIKRLIQKPAKKNNFTFNVTKVVNYVKKSSNVDELSDHLDDVLSKVMIKLRKTCSTGQIDKFMHTCDEKIHFNNPNELEEMRKGDPEDITVWSDGVRVDNVIYLLADYVYYSSEPFNQIQTNMAFIIKHVVSVANKILNQAVMA